eukprot:3089045-Lingulodinium_polyedra.AAC.1
MQPMTPPLAAAEPSSHSAAVVATIKAMLAVNPATGDMVVDPAKLAALMEQGMSSPSQGSSPAPTSAT